MGKAGILASIIGVAVVLIVLFAAFPVIWPIVIDYSANITAMTDTDVGTATFQSFMPLVLLLVGLGIAVSVIVFAVKKFRMSGSI